ncbi:Enoyl-[acyl-carrier-protein] reductase [NADH] FabI [Candidatus Fokinia solitaria]|uniref:Enoyl-[acyl-carrier-protein] reductase [NADH] n=1 Tax=Candidatus Fokinia solitaria TaxID=1802984 RepID=A0A2U8BT02_9RICK|nr:enoyl-ACP reductase [Candidatus Fokinia solitaria]AWD33496.1 Enoyl-[acyl-carrier-protein] reductase [NADH] FabI [Candidatus Fokinia solitaria]
MLKNKIGLIVGLSNEYSIAYKTAVQCYNAGATLALSCQTQLASRAMPLAQKVQGTLYECDATDTASVDLMIQHVKEKFGKLDFVIHSVAFAPKECLSGRFLDTSHSDFSLTMSASCFSFIYLAKAASELMHDGGSIITMTYYGAQKVIPNYNVMGVAKAALEACVRYAALDLGTEKIRVNAISAGPIKTLAASGIGGFSKMLHWVEKNSIMRENVSGADVGDSAVYLVSDMSKNVTGQTLFVDSGYSVVGMKLEE